MHDATSYYVITAYAILLVMCVVGALNRNYDANLAQRVALTIFAVWSAWRIELVHTAGWEYPHEATMATALWIYGVGSAWKTIKYRRLSKKGGRRHTDFMETETLDNVD